MTDQDAAKAASLMGKLSYDARLKRLGLKRIQEIARQNGKKGGRPVGGGESQAKETNKTKKGPIK